MYVPRQTKDPLEHWPKINGKYVCDDIKQKPTGARGNWLHLGARSTKVYAHNEEFKCIFCYETWIEVRSKR